MAKPKPSAFEQQIARVLGEARTQRLLKRRCRTAVERRARRERNQLRLVRRRRRSRLEHGRQVGV